MHYFIALEFVKPIRETFHNYAKVLEKHADKARIVEEEHIHLTLSFLGNLNEEQVEKAKAVVKSIDTSPMNLTFDHLSHFSPSRGGDIVWIGPKENPRLSALYSGLKSALEKEGFKVDQRPFTPHVTLARGVIINDDNRKSFKSTFEPFKTNIASVSLLLSKFEESILTYKTIQRNNFDTL
ncbi:MAG: RNA 2',3'-cyclic phosphodiesterase [Bacillota bacterium]